MARTCTRFYLLKLATNRRIVQIIKKKPTAPPLEEWNQQPTPLEADERCLRHQEKLHERARLSFSVRLFGAILNSSKNAHHQTQ